MYLAFSTLSLPFLLVLRGVSSNDFPCLENLCKKIIKEKQPFERLEVKKETLLEMFKVCAHAMNKPLTLEWLEVQTSEIC